MTLFCDTSTILEEVSIDYDENKIDYMENNKISMLLDDEKNALCDDCMDESIRYATENYYERGTYDS